MRFFKSFTNSVLCISLLLSSTKLFSTNYSIDNIKESIEEQMLSSRLLRSILIELWCMVENDKMNVDTCYEFTNQFLKADNLSFPIYTPFNIPAAFIFFSGAMTEYLNILNDDTVTQELAYKFLQKMNSAIPKTDTEYKDMLIMYLSKLAVSEPNSFLPYLLHPDLLSPLSNTHYFVDIGKGPIENIWKGTSKYRLPPYIISFAGEVEMEKPNLLKCHDHINQFLTTQDCTPFINDEDCFTILIEAFENYLYHFQYDKTVNQELAYKFLQKLNNTTNDIASKNQIIQYLNKCHQDISNRFSDSLLNPEKLDIPPQTQHFEMVAETSTIRAEDIWNGTIETRACNPIFGIHLDPEWQSDASKNFSTLK